MTWLDRAREMSTADVATRLGYEIRRGPSSSHCACPACGLERRHSKSHDKRGAVGIPHKTGGWRCFECELGGDAIDFVAVKLTGRRFPELGDADARRPVQEWFTNALGIANDVEPYMRKALPRPLPPAFENAEVDYPPIADVEALWGSCTPVEANGRALAYLAHRNVSGPNVEAFWECGIARAIGPQTILPSWAQFGGRSWAESGHELILPLYDHNGVMRAVLARSVEREPVRKSVAAAGHGRRGLVIADSIGQLVLRLGPSGGFHAHEPLEVTVFEGEIDFLRHTAGVTESDTALGKCGRVYEYTRHRATFATFGIFSGSWTRDIAARIPGGSVIVCKTDDDSQGDKYAADIAASLGQRVKFERVRIADDRA